MTVTDGGAIPGGRLWFDSRRSTALDVGASGDQETPRTGGQFSAPPSTVSPLQHLALVRGENL